MAVGLEAGTGDLGAASTLSNMHTNSCPISDERNIVLLDSLLTGLILGIHKP